MLTFSDKVILFPLWLFSLLPLRLIYLLSSGLYHLLYYVIGYRKNVVRENLRKSFPEKDSTELKRIEKNFYKHLCDYFFESIYMLNMSRKEVLRRYKTVNPELIHTLYAKGKSLILLTTHYGNWEWAAIGWHQFPHVYLGIYKPLSNKVFDRLFIHLRNRYGSIPIPMKQTLRAITESKNNGDYIILYTVADQRPMKSEIHYWTTFLNQDTPVITGPEKLARRFDLPVVFIDTKKIRRGYYEVTYRMVSEFPAQSAEFEITEKYMRLLEEQIKYQPEYYLWSHKRWKHKRESLMVSA
jgi:KDO2-lipid IV(A) lauroyltransferase